MMLHKLITLVAVTLLLAACSPSEPEVLPEESSTVAELDAAVHTAAQALLEQESIPIAVIYFGWEDREEIKRYEWIDYRAAGDLLAVYEHLDKNFAFGFSLSRGEWRTAQISDEETFPWQAESTLGDVEDVLPSIDQLFNMTVQETPLSTDHDAALSHVVTRQGASDGSELWTLAIPQDAENTMATRQWIINPDGVLQFYRLYTEPLLLGGDVGAIIYEYGITNDDPDPLIIPELESPLRLTELGIPEALLDIEQ